MSANGNIWLWAGGLLIAVWAAHWGGDRISEPFKKLRRQWGFTEVAGAALVGLTAAGPEIGITITTAVRGVADIGVGTMLGANVLAIPAIATMMYWGTHKALAEGSKGETTDAAPGAARDAASRQDTSRQDTSRQDTSRQDTSRQDTESHYQEEMSQVKRDAVNLQVVPYLVVLAVVALLTLPKAWRGFQPIDAWIMLASYIVYLARTFVRGRQEREEIEWTAKEVWLAMAGVVALVGGAYFTVLATESLVDAWGISDLVGGLFITGPLAVMPELFAAWSVSRSGEVAAGTTSVLGDHVATMTLSFVPIALITTPIQDFQLYWVNLVFVALMPSLYGLFIHRGAKRVGFRLWQVLALDLTYLAYLALMVAFILRRI